MPGHGVGTSSRPTRVWPPVPYPAQCRPQASAATSVVPVARAIGALPVAR